MIQLDETAHGREVAVSRGDIVQIRLAETRTTGYRWMTHKGGEPNLELLSESFQPPDRTPGAPGVHVWEFRATQTGTAEIELHSRRPWEVDAPSSKILHVSLRIAS